MNKPSIGVIGAGLAGCEAALVLAQRGMNVVLYEMRPVKTTPAHKTALPAELVCSNSLKSQELPAAQALLKAELDLWGSPLLQCARSANVRAGSALAVDRNAFSCAVKKRMDSTDGITCVTGEIADIPQGHDAVILATGPLTSDIMVDWLTKKFDARSCYFYDAIAPIVSADSIDMNTAFFANRWVENSDDYCNCPFTEAQYRVFHDALTNATVTPARDFEQERFFEACLPIEIIAKRGFEAMSFGPLKPIGLFNPHGTQKHAYAVLQLRRENDSGDSFSMVAFQTRLTIPEQKRVFRMIPGLENAEFIRYGSCHRNTFIDAPTLLENDLSFKSMPDLFCAGQLCGNEGYVESIATGHYAALGVLGRITKPARRPLPLTTAIGALINYVVSTDKRPFAPSSFHFGLLPALDGGKRKKIPKKQKHEIFCNRALEDMKQWLI